MKHITRLLKYKYHLINRLPESNFAYLISSNDRSKLAKIQSMDQDVETSEFVAYRVKKGDFVLV